MAEDLAADLGPLVEDGVQPVHNLAVVGGALDGIERTLQAHLRPGDPVAIEDPAYASVIDLLRTMSLPIVPIPVDGFGPGPAHLAKALARGVKAVVLTPRAANPIGAAFDRDRADDLAAVLADHPDALIIEDDHAGPVAGQPYRRAIPVGRRSWAVIRSVAKSLGPDLRVAGLVGDSTTVARVIGRQSLGPGWVSHLLQRTVAELMGDHDITTLLETASSHYTHRRTLVVDQLRGAGIDVEARSGLNVWVPVDDEARVVTAMANRGFAVRAGQPFRLATGPAIRLSTAAADEATLSDAATALVEVIDGGPPGRSV
jgi:DNA-binding transcriptional MocR family regulator